MTYGSVKASLPEMKMDFCSDKSHNTSFSNKLNELEEELQEGTRKWEQRIPQKDSENEVHPRLYGDLQGRRLMHCSRTTSTKR